MMSRGSGENGFTRWRASCSKQELCVAPSTSPPRDKSPVYRSVLSTIPSKCDGFETGDFDRRASEHRRALPNISAACDGAPTAESGLPLLNWRCGRGGGLE